jgi:hypothetical protein
LNIIKNLPVKKMKSSKDKTLVKGKVVKEKQQSQTIKDKRLSPIAKYWKTIDSNDGEILDMRAVLR